LKASGKVRGGRRDETRDGTRDGRLGLRAIHRVRRVVGRKERKTVVRQSGGQTGGREAGRRGSGEAGIRDGGLGGRRLGPCRSNMLLRTELENAIEARGERGREAREGGEKGRREREERELRGETWKREQKTGTGVDYYAVALRRSLSSSTGL
jgi:hypothetical protein